MKLPKNYIVVIAGLGVLLLLVLFLSKGSIFKSGADDPVDNIKIEQGSDSATVYSSGKVFLRSKTLSGEDFWDTAKTKSFFEIINDKFESGEFIEGTETLEDGSFLVIYNKDEEQVLTYFGDQSASPTPGATQWSGGGSSGGSSGGSGGSDGWGSSGGGSSTPAPAGPDPDCPFWRLSYCVYPRTPTPVQTPSGTTNPFPNLVYDCDLGDSTVTQRTVISNTLCVKEPTPSPTP